MVVVVDDGIATGATLRATIRVIRLQRPAAIVCAVPVSARDSASAVGGEVDRLVCPLLPRFFRAVGEWYLSFGQTSDEEVVALLEEARSRLGEPG